MRATLLTLCLFFMLSSLPYALVWFFLKLVGFMKDVRHLSVRFAPLLATLFFLIVPLCLAKLNSARISSFELWSSGLFLPTFFLPFLSALGLILARPLSF